MYRGLELADVFAVIAYYPAHWAEIDENLASVTNKRKPAPQDRGIAAPGPTKAVSSGCWRFSAETKSVS